MAAPERTILYGLAVKAETTEGTYITPTMAADALRLAGPPVVNWGYALPGRREGVATGDFGMPASAKPLGRWATVEFTTEVVHSGTVDTAPRLGRIFEPFMIETVSASTDVAYVPAATVKKTVSVLLQDAGKQFQIRGAVPERIVWRGPDSEGRVLMDCTLGGILVGDPTEQALEAQTFGDQSATPPVFGGASVFTVGATAIIFRSFELDFGLTARRFRIDRNEADNLKFGIVTQVNPIIRFPAEVEVLSTHNPFSRQADPATALVFSLTIGAAGDQYVITGAHVEYDPENLGLSDEDLLKVWDLELPFKQPASGDFFKISHT